MKKPFVKATIFSLLTLGAASSFVACKDYDDDINNIGAVNDDQAKQLSALQTALTEARAQADTAGQKAQAAQEAASAAAAKGDEAMAAAQAAQASAALAEKAAAEAKAEAIAAALKAVEDAMASAPTAETVNRLSTQLSALSSDLNLLSGKVDNALSAIDQLQTQMKALQAYEQYLKQLPQALQDLADAQGQIAKIQSSVSSIETAMTQLQSQVGKNTQDISAINSQLNQLSQQVADIQPNLLTLLSHRLTSVTLMPSLYVGGIPTIEFTSARYIDQQNPTKTYIVSNGRNKVEYRLNPSGVKAADIELNNLSFVTRTATARAGEPTIINVASADVDNGVLTVYAGKANTASLNLSGNQIYTVALRVPIAASLLAENESNPAVFSEYSRVEESYFTPMLHSNIETPQGSSVPANLALLSDSLAVYSAGFDAELPSSLIAYRMAYDTTVNLDDVIAGWGVYEDTSRGSFFLSHSALEGYGFDINYAIATKPYETAAPDKTNQQLYARISGSTLTPCTPTGATNNQAIIGKQPIIRATLFDKVNNKIVAIKYIKILFKAVDLPDQKFTVDTDEALVNCQDQTIVTVDWQDFTKNVLEKYSNGESSNPGISKKDFFNIYGENPTISVSPAFSSGSIISSVRLSDIDAAVPVLTWSVDKDAVGHIDFGSSKTWKATITFTDPKGLYPNVVITWPLTITNPLSLKLSDTNIGKIDALKWTNEVLKVVPVPMAEDYDPASGVKAYYSTNIFDGRYKPYITGSNILSCAQFGIELAKAHISEYNGASLSYPASATVPMGMTAFNNLDVVSFNIAHNSAGIALVESEKLVKLDWYTDENGLQYNQYNFFTNSLQIVKPLTFSSAWSGNGFVDDGMAQTLSLTNPVRWTITDCYGNNVSNVSSAGTKANKLWAYYGVNGPVFNASDIWISDTNTGTGSNLRSPSSVLPQAQITLVTDATGTSLKFQNAGGGLASDAYIRVSLQFTHEWGAKTVYLFVPLKHTLN